MWSRFPSLLRKCGYCNENVISRSVSKRPLGGKIISFERRIRLLDCILTAIDMDAKSEPNGLNTTSLDSVREHNLERKIQHFKLLLF